MNIKIIRHISIAFPILIMGGCVKGLPDHEDTDTWEMYRTLAYYKYVEQDTLKYAAAQYLIENMPYHSSNARIYKDNDTLVRWLHETDSIYYSFVHGRTMKNFPWDTLWHVKKTHRKLIEADTLPDKTNLHTLFDKTKELFYKLNS